MKKYSPFTFAKILIPYIIHTPTWILLLQSYSSTLQALSVIGGCIVWCSLGRTLIELRGILVVLRSESMQGDKRQCVIDLKYG